MPSADTPAADWSATRRTLAEAVRRAPGGGTGQRVRCVVCAAPAGTTPAAWLTVQPAPRGFWQGRAAREGGRHEAARAFAGVAERFEDPARLCTHLAGSLPGPPLRYYGGVRFDPDRPDADGWQRFGPGAFVLPRFELVGPAEGPPRLMCYLAPGDDPARVAAQVERLPVPAGTPAKSPGSEPGPSGRALGHRRDYPTRAGWEESVHAALHAVEDAALQKVVLARRTRFDLGVPLDPVALLHRLRAGTPAGFAFLVQPAQAGAFLGVSPERLFRQRGRVVESEAVAGTRPRAAAAAADTALRDALLNSDKDRREHAFVQRYIAEALRSLCVSLEERDAAPLALPYGRHLRASVQGQLREDVSPARVLQALHPTPAVGGVPPGAARSFIREHEPFDRGWYAAPVGWIGRVDGAPAADLAVGIRSGLVHEGGRQLDLFAGAGLVEGSVPGAEWDEIEQKVKPFTTLFETA